MNHPHTITGMGEIVLDILFRHNQPFAAVPGGSSFNAVVSLARAGAACRFIGCVAPDHAGLSILSFMEDNGIDTSLIAREQDRSTISLAFLDERNEATYSFYRPARPRPPKAPEGIRFGPEDFLLFGSFYACNPENRDMVQPVLARARQGGAVVCYDLNFRRSHAARLPGALPLIRQNMSQSTIVRASTEDLGVVFGTTDPREAYEAHIRPLCPLFISTAGAGMQQVFTPGGTFGQMAPALPRVVSTVGAGDSFMAGLVWHMARRGLGGAALARLGREEWPGLLATASAFAAATCAATDNYVPRGFRP